MIKDANNADRRRAGLRHLLTTKRITCSDLAREIGLPNANTLFNFLNGRSASLSVETVERILIVHPDVGFHDLVGLQPPAPGGRRRASPNLLVTVELCAGVWRTQIELPAEEWSPAPLIPARASDAGELFAARIRYPGAERLYPDGSVLLCRRMRDDSSTPADGAHIITVQRRRSKVEVAVRELRQTGDEVWLWPCSTHLHHQQPVLLDGAPSESDDAHDHAPAVLLWAIVIASWQPVPAAKPT